MQSRIKLYGVPSQIARWIRTQAVQERISVSEQAKAMLEAMYTLRLLECAAGIDLREQPRNRPSGRTRATRAHEALQRSI